MTDSPTVTQLLHEQGRFRQVAADHLASAKRNFAGEKGSLAYCALDLRMALEALVYDNAATYADELTPDDLRTWQPPKLLDKLIEIDPIGEFGMELQVQHPDTGVWTSLGREARMGLKTLKKHYHALGSHLHSPTLQQVLNLRQPSQDALRRQCEQCIEDVGRVLDSSLWRLSLRPLGTTELDCSGCGGIIRRRLNALADGPHKMTGDDPHIVVDCPGCKASFEIRLNADQQPVWREQRWFRACPHRDCEGGHAFWFRELVDGASSECETCGRAAILRSVLLFTAEEALRQTDEGDDAAEGQT